MPYAARDAILLPMRRAAGLPGSPVALVTGAAGAVVALLAAGAAYAGRPLLVALLVLLQLLLAAAWLAWTSTPSRLTGLLLATGAGLVADLLLARRASGGSVGALAGVVGVSVVLGVLAQLADRRRRRVTDTLAAQTSAVLLCCTLACVMALRVGPHGRDAAVAVLIGLAAGGLLSAAVASALRTASGRWPMVARAAAWVGAGAGAGAIALGGDGALIGLAAGIAGAVAEVTVSLGAGRRPVPVLAALLPLAMGSPAAYVAGRVLLG